MNDRSVESIVGRVLQRALFLSLLACFATTGARADAIFAVQNTNGSPTIKYSQITSGNYTIDNLLNGSNSSGSINVHLDQGGISSFSAYYYGTTGYDAGSTIRCQNFTLPSGTTTCSVYDPNNSTSYWNGAKTPNNLTLGSYKVTFYFATTQTTDFNFAWSSFSGGGYTGCMSGTSKCTPTSAVPEPASLLLLAGGSTILFCLKRRSMR